MIWYSVYVLVGFVSMVIFSKVTDGFVTVKDFIGMFLFSLLFGVFLILIELNAYLKENNKYEEWGNKKIF